jgi:hypothetical protein
MDLNKFDASFETKNFAAHKTSIIYLVIKIDAPRILI